MDLFLNKSYYKEGNNFNFLQSKKTNQHYFINILIGICFGMSIIILSWIIAFLRYFWLSQEKKCELNRYNDIVKYLVSCQDSDYLSFTSTTFSYDQNKMSNEPAVIAISLWDETSSLNYLTKLEMGTLNVGCWM